LYSIGSPSISEFTDRVLRDLLFDGDGTFKPVRFVDELLAAFPGGTFVTPMNDLGGDIIYRYDDERGFYVSDGVAFTEQALKSVLGEATSKTYYSRVLKHLQVETYVEPRRFQEAPGALVLANGVYLLNPGELAPYSPEYRARNALPVEYDPDAECPTFLGFLERVLPREESRLFFQEWLGYHLIKDYRYQRVVVLQGDGDNGKSTLLGVMTALLGRENVSSENLYRLSSNRFSPAELHGKLANISADIGPEEMRYTGVIKMLSGGDLLTVERKNRDPFQFRNYAKLTFSCNQLPRTPDETLAFYKRFIVLVTGDPVPKEEQDPRLLEKMTSPGELSGILNWALEGLSRCLERGRLEEPSDVLERRELYQNMSDPVTGFYNEYIEEDREAFEIKQDVLNAFNDYCRGKGFVALSDRKFMERFKKIAYFRAYRPKLWTDDAPKGKQHHCMRGIKLSDACHKTEYWTSREAYMTARGNQKRLIPGKNSQDSQDSQGSQTRKKSEDQKNSELVEADYPDYPDYLGGSSAELAAAAERILRDHEGRMTQTALWEALEEEGHKWSRGADYVLRGDPRFAFRGLNVHLVKEPAES
jgi:P4 family phage/plasmid primase-like protien